jgi:hypothetical protein
VSSPPNTSDTPEAGNRTFIGGVVFIDIVGYARKPVSEQAAMKQRFSAHLANALSVIPPEERIVLDTGDGAAISFLGSADDALQLGIALRDALKLEASTSSDEENATDLLLRIGINWGPIKLVRDTNGHPNIVGDGINVAQRIMSFARSGQVVVSRPYYDVVCKLSDDYAQLFKYEGSRTDKHVREHEIFVAGESSGDFTPAAAPGADETSGAVPFLQDRKKLAIAGGALGALVLALGIAVAMKTDRPPIEQRQKSSSTLPTEAKAASVPPTSGAPTENVVVTPPNPANDTAPQVVAGAGTSGSAPPIAVAGTTAPPSAATGINSAPAVPATKQTKVDTASPNSAKTDASKAIGVAQGGILFAIQPWGEVFVNGRSVGVSPPLKQTRLNPGKYKIEVKNSNLAPYVVTVEVRAKEDISVRHKFQ